MLRYRFERCTPSSLAHVAFDALDAAADELLLNLLSRFVQAHVDRRFERRFARYAFKGHLRFGDGEIDGSPRVLQGLTGEHESEDEVFVEMRLRTTSQHTVDRLKGRLRNAWDEM